MPANAARAGSTAGLVEAPAVRDVYPLLRVSHVALEA